ncbi:hypothetical protein AB1Y20_003873 [Prymnesium parvum]|uniref:Uncharacterized protein n=1 Tax=Prymnesium parvum TaxID=97485 RepID=A0AB34J901_PRYPA
MPRVLLATDEHGNAKVFTVPSPVRESAGGGVDSTAAVETVAPGADSTVAELSAGLTAGAGGAHHAELSSSAAWERVDVPWDAAEPNADFVLVPRAGETAEDIEAPSIELVRTPQSYWVARGFSPMVASALEECCVSPALVVPGAPLDELGVLADTRSCFGDQSAVVTSWVAAAYGQSHAARVVHTTHVALQSGAACSAGGSGTREVGRGGSGRGARNAIPTAQETSVDDGGVRTAQQVERGKE